MDPQRTSSDAGPRRRSPRQSGSWSGNGEPAGCRSESAPASDHIPHHAAPSRAKDLSGLPPTYIMVGGLDAFADEDIEYAKRLNHAGVAVELHVYPGAPHAFEGMAANTAVAKQARRDINNWLGARLASAS